MGGHLYTYDIVSPGLSLSNVLWRYMDLPKFIDLLESKSLRLSRGDKFSDKFEGSFTPSLKLLITQAYEDNGISMTYAEFKDKLRERIYINCWCNRKSESMAMWQLYGGSNCAVAVITTVSRIRNAIMSSPFALKTYIKKVDYIDHFDDPDIEISPYSNIFAYKQNAYDHEKEVRVLLDMYHETFEDPKMPESLSMPLELEDFIFRVVIAPHAPEWFSVLVKKIVKNYNLGIVVDRSSLSIEPV